MDEKQTEQLTPQKLEELRDIIKCRNSDSLNNYLQTVLNRLESLKGEELKLCVEEAEVAAQSIAMVFHTDIENTENDKNNIEIALKCLQVLMEKLEHTNKIKIDINGLATKIMCSLTINKKLEKEFLKTNLLNLENIMANHNPGEKRNYEAIVDNYCNKILEIYGKIKKLNSKNKSGKDKDIDLFEGYNLPINKICRVNEKIREDKGDKQIKTAIYRAASIKTKDYYFKKISQPKQKIFELHCRIKELKGTSKNKGESLKNWWEKVESQYYREMSNRCFPFASFFWQSKASKEIIKNIYENSSDEKILEQIKNYLSNPSNLNRRLGRVLQNNLPFFDSKGNNNIKDKAVSREPFSKLKK